MGHGRLKGQRSNRFCPRPNFIALVYISVSSVSALPGHAPTRELMAGPQWGQLGHPHG